MSRRIALRIPAALALATGSLSAAGSAQAKPTAQAEPTALHVPGDVHLAALGRPGATGVAHTIRRRDGSWDGVGHLPTSHSQRNLVSAVVAGEEHLLFEDYSGLPYRPSLHHLVRHADGTWTELFGGPGFTGSTADLAVAAVAGELHVVRRSTGEGTPKHAVRRGDGTWTSATDIPVPATPDSRVVIAGAGTDLRLLTDDIPGRTALSSFVRHSDGTWERTPDVPFRPSAAGVTATTAEVAQVGSDLHAVVRGSDGGLYHSVLRPGHPWDTFHDVAPEAGAPAGVVQEVAITASGDALHVAVTGSAPGLFHAIRRADGRWQRFADVTAEVGPVGSGFSLTLAGG